MGLGFNAMKVDAVEAWCGEALPAPVKDGTKAPASAFFGSGFKSPRTDLMSDFYSVLVRMYPQDPCILGESADFAWKRLHRNDLAEELFERARILGGLPASISGLEGAFKFTVARAYAEFLVEMGRAVEAATVLEEALTTDWDLRGAAHYAVFLARYIPARRQEAASALEALLGQGESQYARASVYREYGRLLLVLGRKTDAIANFEMALSIDPSFEFRARLVIALVNEQPSPANLDRAFQLAVRDLKSDAALENVILAVDVACYLRREAATLTAVVEPRLEGPDAPPGLLSAYAFYLGSVENNHARASELFRKAGGSTSDDPRVVLRFAAWNWESLGTRDTAGVAYRRALQLYPRSAEAHARLAQLSFIAGDSRSGAAAALEASRLGDIAGDFCLFAYLPDHREEAGCRLKAAIRDGEVRDEHLAGLAETDPARTPLLQTLAKVLNGQEPATVLNQFPEWAALPVVTE